MPDSPVPEWITERQRDEADRKRQDEQDAQSQSATAHSLRVDGPKFWKRLLARLEVNVNALTLLPDELNGSVSPGDGTAESPELSCHVEVNRRSTARGAASAMLNLYYLKGGARIRRYDHRELGDITLEVRHDVLAVIDDKPPKTAEELADHIVSTMAEPMLLRRS